MSNETQTLSNRTRALIRDLANLSVVADTLERIGSIEQAEREALARTEAANNDAKRAEEESQVRQQAATEEIKKAVAAEAEALEGLKSERAAVQTAVDKARNEHQTLAAEIKAQQAKLDATRAELASIASRIG